MSCSTTSRISTFIVVLHKICEDYDNDDDHFPIFAGFESIQTLFKLMEWTKPEIWDDRKIHADFEELLEFIRGEVKNLCKEEMPTLWRQIKNLLKQFADVTHEPVIKKEPDDETVVKRQRKMKPMVAKRVSPIEYEVISDEEEDEEGEEPVVIDDEKDVKKEHFVTPKLKRPRMQTPRAPRVVRRKIIFWKTVDEFVVPDDVDDDDDKKQN